MTPYFLNYQRDWILDFAPLRICEKSRQVGMSYADSYDSVCKAACLHGRDVWVVSRDENQAKQYIRYCRRWARVLNLAASELGQPILRVAFGKTAQVQALTFANGRTIFALSSSPDAIAGKTGHVKLDEFALHRGQRELYAVAKPVTQWGGTLSVISTHRGAHTVFNEILTGIEHGGNPMGWSRHRITIQDAVDQGIVERIQSEPSAGRGRAAETREQWLARQRAECIDQEQWLQEYCCVPADESAAFLSFELLNGCVEPGCLKDFSYLANCANPLYVGIDVGRKHDLCVLDVGEKIGDVTWDRLRIELAGRSFGEIEYELYRLLGLRQVKFACIDATGLGMQLAERARERFAWKIEMLTFTAPLKEELACGLRADFERRSLRISEDDRLRADLRGIRKEVTSSGNLRFAGESEDSHCDRFWAKALRQHAARRKVYTAARIG